MKKLLLFCLAVSPQLHCIKRADPAAAQGAKLLDQKYTALKALHTPAPALNEKYQKLQPLYNQYVLAKQLWFKPRDEQHLQDRIALAQAKGDTQLAQQIQQHGHQNKYENAAHIAWQWRAPILGSLAFISMLRNRNLYNKLPRCPISECNTDQLHTHEHISLFVPSVTQGYSNRGSRVITSLIFRKS